MKINCVTTQDDIIAILKQLKVLKGHNVFVHSSLSSLGYVVNGAIDVIDALIERICIKKGTILMPAHSGHLSEPTDWQNPAIPKKFIEVIKKNMKPFDARLTSVRGRGIIPEVFLKYPHIKRSQHPLKSVSALGRLASYLTREHAFHEPEGTTSPIGKLYECNGYILLLGVGLGHCTEIHLAEYIADVPYLYESKMKVLRLLGGEKCFDVIKRYPNGAKYFDKLMPNLQKGGLINTVEYNNKKFHYFKLKPVIDMALQFLKTDPYYLVKK